MGEGHCDPQKEVQAVKRLLILGVVGIAVVAVGIATAVAATGGNGGASATRGATVAAKRLPGAGLVLVDSKGRALYRSDQELRGMVLCKGACLSFWQPLTVTGTSRLAAPTETVTFACPSFTANSSPRGSTLTTAGSDETNVA